MKSYHYCLSGITLQVPFRCPALQESPSGMASDVIVVDGAVPMHLEGSTHRGLHWEMAPGRYLWRGGNFAGRFLLEGEGRVTVQRNRGATDGCLAYHLVEGVLLELLRKRGFLLLHSNGAVLPDGCAVAVAGESGAGKSTTIAALVARGLPLLADDIAVLRLGPGGRPEMVPGIPKINLLHDAALNLGHDPGAYEPQHWRRMKIELPAHLVLGQAPAPLKAIFQLKIVAEGPVRKIGLYGQDKFKALHANLSGRLVPEEHSRQFPLVAAILEHVAVFRLERPARGWSIHEVVEEVLSV